MSYLQPTRKVVQSQGPTIIMLVLALLLLGSQSFASQELPASDRQKFKLHAHFEDRPQLSRSELEQGENNIGTANKEGGERRLASIPFAPPAVESMSPGFNGLPLRSTGQRGTASGPPSPYDGQSQKGELDTDIQRQEYWVDWSKWMGRLVDRWYLALRRLEQESGLRFYTPHPALIGFTCYADGRIANIFLKQSSGIPLYDRMQVQALLLIAPLDAFPAGTMRSKVTLVQGWECHPPRAGELDYQLGSFGKGFPLERVSKWLGLRQ